MASDASTRGGLVPMYLRVPVEIRRRAKAAAGAQDISMNEYVTAVLGEHLPRLEAAPLPAAG